MSRKSKEHTAEPALHTHNEMRKNIKLQTEVFLRMGGTIQRVPNGASGQLWKTYKHSKSSK